MIQTRSTLRLSITAAAFCLLSACGGGEKNADLAGPCTSGSKTETPKAEKAEESAGAQGGWTTALSQTDMTAYGKQIFLARGSNTCNDCHGKDGKKGRLEQAADLTKPASWRATKALEGDSVKVNAALTYLISNGGKKFNENYVNDNAGAGWSWEKSGATQYDIQMFGVTQSSTKAEVKKIRKALKKKGISMAKNEMTAFGTQAVLAYLSSIASDTPGDPAEAGKGKTIRKALKGKKDRKN
jgi:mono/diheme cytochrome c family protein